jgi:catechol 2,3-dioxygenase-like lactoylglutathione lyase family enzyme
VTGRADTASAYAAAYGMVVPDVAALKVSARTMTADLRGVHHAARPTWRLRETVVFYRDVLGLPLVHCISAKGWGPEGHPDFLHFFFDIGYGSTVAFFYYFGTTRPPNLAPEYSPEYMATHVAWRTSSAASLAAWQVHLVDSGVGVSRVTEHEVIDSIYFQDPNGYPLEITFVKRDFAAADTEDAALTLRAALEALDADSGASLEDVWRAKGRLVDPGARGDEPVRSAPR